MKIVNTEINKIKPYSMNARIHSSEQIDQLCESIKSFGFNNPILLDASMTVIAGHGRLEAAKRLAMTSVPSIIIDHLTEAQKKAYIIADNKIALNSGWNEELLAEEIEALFNLDIKISKNSLGFSDKELAKLFDSTAGITIEDSLNEKELSEIIVKFQSCDKTEIMNAINFAISEFKDAHVWLESDE